MSGKEVLKLHEVLHSLTTKMPKILLQRAEHKFPALKVSMVGVACMQ